MSNEHTVQVSLKLLGATLMPYNMIIARYKYSIYVKSVCLHRPEICLKDTDYL